MALHISQNTPVHCNKPGTIHLNPSDSPARMMRQKMWNRECPPKQANLETIKPPQIDHNYTNYYKLYNNNYYEEYEFDQRDEPA